MKHTACTHPSTSAARKTCRKEQADHEHFMGEFDGMKEAKELRPLRLDSTMSPAYMRGKRTGYEAHIELARHIRIYDEAAVAASEDNTFTSAEYRAYHGALQNADDTMQELGFERVSDTWYSYFVSSYTFLLDEYKEN